MSFEWLWLTLPVALGALVVLAVATRRLVRTMRGGDVASVPLAGEAEVVLDRAGSFLLHAEGARGSRAFRGLDYRLEGIEDGVNVSLSHGLVPTSSSGWSRARHSLRAFEIDRPGRYRLLVDGLAAGVEGDERLVITHDRRGRMVVQILLVVVSGISLIAGSVLSAIVLAMNA